MLEFAFCCGVERVEVVEVAPLRRVGAEEEDMPAQGPERDGGDLTSLGGGDISI